MGRDPRAAEGHELGRDRGASGGITRQSAHERYKEAVEEWQLSLVEPFYPASGSGHRALRIHEAAYHPTQTGRQLDEWAQAHVPGYRDDPHPVTGHLSPLSTAEEMVQVLDAINHLQVTTSPEERATVYERKASLLERIAAEDGNPKAAEQAAEAGARAAQLRAQADTS